MMSKIKTAARNTGLAPYLAPMYRRLIKHPYWYARRRLYPKQKVTVSGAAFYLSVREPRDLEYHEMDSERDVIRDVVANTTDEDVFYDIGANIGLYSLAVAASAPGASVLAFEPSPVAFDRLQRNIALNDSDVAPYNLAISDTVGELPLSVDTRDPFSRQSTLSTDADSTRYDRVTVRSKSISAVLEDADIPPPTVLKIDVEGAELAVLEGASSAIEDVRLLYCEVHEDALVEFDADRSDVVTHLQEAGFETTTLEVAGENLQLKARRDDK